MNLWELLVILLMVLINGLLAAYELALASVKLPRLKALGEARRPGAEAALMMRLRMEASMAVVQLGITLSAAIAGAMGGVNAHQTFAPHLASLLHLSRSTAEILSVILIVIPLATLTILVGELLPKVFALRNPEWVCMVLGPSMRVFFWACYPAVWGFEWTTKLTMRLLGTLFPKAPLDRQSGIAELRAQVSMLRAANFIGVQQEQIIVQAARLSGLKVGDIMLPAEDIVMLFLDAPLTESMVTAHLDLHTRFPVTEERGNRQKIIGYVNFKEMMFLAKTHPANPSLREITRPIIHLEAGLAVSEALRRMIGEHVHLALVVDGANQVIGMVTQEDVFEELVGDIQDEFDRLPRQIIPSGKQLVVGGGATLGRLREALGRPELGLDYPPLTTVNEWLSSALKRRPRGGDTVQLQGLSVLVRKVRRHKVTEVLLDPTGKPLLEMTEPPSI